MFYTSRTKPTEPPLTYRSYRKISLIYRMSEHPSQVIELKRMRYVMGESQKPQDCKHYPLCKHFKPLFADLHSDNPDTNEVVFPRDAEPICAQCVHFTPRKGLQRA